MPSYSLWLLLPDWSFRRCNGSHRPNWPERSHRSHWSHRPDYIDLYRQYPFDLVLSGHTHGGQVCIPLLVNGLFAPNQGWLPKYAGGQYDVEGTCLVISRGLSYNPRLPRVFNPPEVVIVDVEGTAR